MSVTDLQKRTAQAIVNIFETGKALGDYGRVTFVEGDKGELTYGRSQATLASGSLAALIASYCQTPGATLAVALSPFLPALTARDSTLNLNMGLRGALHDAGADPVMRHCQDVFFDTRYWEPALKSAQALSL
ncbi:MAG: chitosanase, partial [Magnetospirillum sp.]